MGTTEIIGLAAGGTAVVAILAWWGYIFYRRVIKDEKADFTKRDY